MYYNKFVFVMYYNKFLFVMYCNKFVPLCIAAATMSGSSGPNSEHRSWCVLYHAATRVTRVA